MDTPGGRSNFPFRAESSSIAAPHVTKPIRSFLSFEIDATLGALDVALLSGACTAEGQSEKNSRCQKDDSPFFHPMDLRFRNPIVVIYLGDNRSRPDEEQERNSLSSSIALTPLA